MKRRSFNKTLYNNVYSESKSNSPVANRLKSSNIAACDSGLYRYVFASRMALLAAFALCISLLLQPVTSAYAQEVVEELDTNVSDSAAHVVAEEVLILEEEESDEQEIVTVVEQEEPETEDLQTETQHEEYEAAEEIVEAIVEEILTGTTTTEVADDEPAAESESGTSTNLVVATSTDDGVDEEVSLDTSDTASTTTETVESDSTDDEQVPDDSSAPPETVDEQVSTTTASTTGEIVVVSSVQTDNTLAFGKNECTEVADGSFYCQKLSLDDLPEDALFAAPDSTGDMEIFVVQDGVERKVTDNTVDDASPYYDARSETLVWHRLTNDRYQIISYDIDSGAETQLTDTKVNNMEPTRNGDYTVWQRWVTNNWEIILFDGEVETQITDSRRHDIAPHIHGDLIIWNVRSSDGTESLMTYDITTQSYNEIADADGVSVTNPRMLVMYEAEYQNGDTVIKGFDLATGEIVPIERLPRELPDEIPSPETTGEVRALPTNQNTENEIVVQDDPDPDPDDSPDLSLSTTTASSSSSATSTEAIEDLDLRDIQNRATTTTDRLVEQATIPDVVVEVFTPTTTDSTSTSTQQ